MSAQPLIIPADEPRVPGARHLRNAFRSLSHKTPAHERPAKPPPAVLPVPNVPHIIAEDKAPVREPKTRSVRKLIRSLSHKTPAPAALADPLPTLGDVLRSHQKGMIIPWEQLKVERVLAKGAFGRVSKGKHNFTDVAIKELHSGGHIGNLLDEVEAMRKLYHPNLLATIGLASDFTKHLGLVMEFLPASLYSLLHSDTYRTSYRGHLTWARCFLALSTDVAHGFEYLHNSGFVHRDLKPHNVLVSAAWHAKVADFGEAQREAGKGQTHKDPGALVPAPASGDSGDAAYAFTESPNRLQKSLTSGVSSTLVSIAGTGYLTTATPTGMFMSMAQEKDRVHGTAPYLSPEAASAGTEQQVDPGPPTDVWGFGCLLVHIAARAPPYADIFTKQAQVVYALRDGVAKPLSQMTEANTPAKLRAIAARCCTWKPEERPTFTELSQLLGSPDTVHEVCGELAVCDDEEFEAARPEPRLEWLVDKNAQSEKQTELESVCEDNEVDPATVRSRQASDERNSSRNKEACALM